jgi:hypothetical protein
MFAHGYHPIPPGLDDMAPGLELAALCGGIDVHRVSPYDRIVVLRARQRLASHFQAQVYAAMASVVEAMEADPDEENWATEAATAEIRVALHLTRTAADTEVRFALELQRRLPAVWDAFITAGIDLRRAKVFSTATAHLPDAAARLVVERVIDSAGELTTGELRARLERLIIEADPDAAAERYASAVNTRRLHTESSGDGTAHLLGLDLPPHRVNAASRRINHLARSLKTKGETRTMDQLRADVYLDLLLTTTGTAKNAAGGGVHLYSDLDTLAGLAAHPGELNGWGPVIADVARQVAEEQQDTEWRWSVTHPQTGEIIHDGITRRRPTTTLRRSVEAKDHTCIFPGCRMPAVDCDLDHLKRWADGGETTEDNLAPACRHDNLLKERHHWTCQRLPNGTYRWTTNSATPTQPEHDPPSESGGLCPRSHQFTRDHSTADATPCACDLRGSRPRSRAVVAIGHGLIGMATWSPDGAQPLTTPSGRRRATREASPAASHTLTTSSTSL